MTSNVSVSVNKPMIMFDASVSEKSFTGAKVIILMVTNEDQAESVLYGQQGAVQGTITSSSRYIFLQVGTSTCQRTWQQEAPPEIVVDSVDRVYLIDKFASLLYFLQELLKVAQSCYALPSRLLLS